MTPSWVVLATADAARQLLKTPAGAVITGQGLVCSITIVTLTQASTRDEPRVGKLTELTLLRRVAPFR